ncbi:MAG: NADH-dependent dehydrogenase [Isosphaeraceae bacterium]|jgi:predicted dehydrogenase|nr:MAG: NADH-dependent dehydrogenase [Isosphaeraceae bacterium]
MTTLTPEQKAIGRENARSVLGVTRRRFLQGAAVAPVAGAFYFGYKAVDRPVRAAIIGTGNEGCQAMIHDHNPEYLQFIGFCDIRPSQQKRAVETLRAHGGYSSAEVEAFAKNMYPDVDAMLADPNVEMVVIALPLWLHAPVAIKALRAGKHVFCEKLMAHSVGECKAMCRVAHETNKMLAIGHQRHYSALYDNANYLVENGHLGEIRHIRALWHRNNATPRYQKKDGQIVYDAQGNPIPLRDDQGNILYYDSWKPDIPAEDRQIDVSQHVVRFRNGKGKEWTYRYKDLQQLVQWRLYNQTGAGLMAELGSHQLDACSIFLGKVHPTAVTGIGGTFFYDDGREVDDHVFVTFEFPTRDDPEARGHDRVVVTYSSINTNRFENYGEMVYGTRGTMIVEGEKEILLYKEADANTGSAGGKGTYVTVADRGGKPTVETSPSLAGASTPAVPGTAWDEAPSRGYREELEHFAYCIRANQSDRIYEVDDATLIPRCHGEIALADAVIALTSNLAMRQRRRIDFDPNWFDFRSDATPDQSEEDIELAL